MGQFFGARSLQEQRIKNIPTIIFLSQTVCIRQAQGYCCVEYVLCSDQVSFNIRSVMALSLKLRVLDFTTRSFKS
jgi:hypothetical protein